MTRIEINLQILNNEREIKDLKHAIRQNTEIIEENRHDLAWKGLDYDWKMHMLQEIDDLTAENENLERQKHKLEKANDVLRSGSVVKIKDSVKPVVFCPEQPLAISFTMRFSGRVK